MNPQDQIPKPTGEPVELDAESTDSVDDFIRELEEKERDLHITSELSIEIADPDFEAPEPVVPPPTPAVPVDMPVAAARVAPIPEVLGVKKDRTRALDLENEVASLKMRVFELRNERNEVQEKSDRRLKDFENYRYRMDRERRGAFIDQIANLASQLLPVLDNLNRAIDTIPDGGQKSSPEFEQLFDGIVLVNQQMNEVLAGMGVTHIASVGEAFDPNFHEAVATEQRDDMVPNTVSEEFLRGYRIGNKVIRHSMVRVAMAEPSSAPRDSDSASDDKPELDGTLA